MVGGFRKYTAYSVILVYNVDEMFRCPDQLDIGPEVNIINDDNDDVDNSDNDDDYVGGDDNNNDQPRSSYSS